MDSLADVVSYLLVAVGAVYAVYHIATGLYDGKKRLTAWKQNKHEAPAYAEVKHAAATRQALRRMLWGGAAFMIGALATGESYSDAISTNSGSYTIFSGLMAVGGVFSLVGLIQYITKWDLN